MTIFLLAQKKILLSVLSCGRSSILFSLESHRLGGRGELSICTPPGMIGIVGLVDGGLLLPLPLSELSIQ